MIGEPFKELDLLGQFVLLVTTVLGCTIIGLNLLCVFKIVNRKSFCMTSTASNIIILSLFGSNCLVGLTAIAKEVTFVFLGKNTPKYWNHFAGYITIFCLITSTLHMMLISSTYLINTFRTFPRPVKNHGRISDTVFISIIWILSLIPSSIRSDVKSYEAFLKAISIMLLACICCLVPLGFCVLHFHQKTCNGRSSSEHFNAKSNLVKKRWLRYRHKEKTICLCLMASYLLCSCPYMIYYPVLSNVHNGTHIPDLIDDILFLFILAKCMCDACIYIVKKGWKRDQKRVNFRLQNDETSPAHV